MSIIVLPLVCFGMIAVCLCFTFLFPVVAKITASLFFVYAGEASIAKIKKIESGSKFINPNDILELQTVPEPINRSQDE